MKLKELFFNVRPVYVESQHFEDYPYFQSGTCFICSFKNNYYVFTARHNLKEIDNTQSLCIFINDKEKSLIPFTLLSSPELNEISDEELMDFVFLKVNKDQLTSDQLNSFKALNFDTFKEHDSVFRKGDKLFVNGFPYINSEIDYHTKTLKYQKVSMDGIYNKSFTSNYYHEMRVLNDIICDYNGFSGSPVLKLVENGGKYDVFFAGIVTRGSFDSRLMYFIDFKILLAALDKMI